MSLRETTRSRPARASRPVVEHGHAPYTSGGAAPTKVSRGAENSLDGLSVEHGPRVLPLTGRGREVLLARLRTRQRRHHARDVMRTAVTTDLLAGLIAVGLVAPDPVFAAVALAGGLALLAAGGRYRSRRTLSALDDLPPVAIRLQVACLLGGVTAELVGTGLPLATVALVAAVWIVLAVLGRMVGYQRIRRGRRRTTGNRTLVVGAGSVGQQVHRILAEHPEYGMTPVGFVDDAPLAGTPAEGAPVLGAQADLQRIILDRDVRSVVVAFSAMPESDLVELIRSCDRVDCEIYHVPRLFELNTRPGSADMVWGLPLIRVPRPAFRSPTRWTKRALDVAVSAVALALLSPVIGVLALLVRLETGGVLFRQVRVGTDGRPFEVLKLQSMRPADETESSTRWNVAQDARVGRVGRFVRATSLDELPQLWNVLRGDMSLVGPRPERPHFVDEFSRTYPRYHARTRVAAGLTGWSQIHDLRGDTSIEERQRFDNYYIEHWSAWGDIKILLRTVPTVLLGKGG